MHCKLGESWLCFLPQSPGRCFPSPSCSSLHSFHLPVSSLKQLCRIPWSGAGIHTKCGSRGNSGAAPELRGREASADSRTGAECSEWSPVRGRNVTISVLHAGWGDLGSCFGNPPPGVCQLC